MRQGLFREEWNELTAEQKGKFRKALAEGFVYYPTLGHLIEFLHSTGYDWEIGFGKKTFDPTGEVEFERNIFRVRLPEEGLIFRDKELINALFACVKEVLKNGKD